MTLDQFIPGVRVYVEPTIGVFGAPQRIYGTVGNMMSEGKSETIVRFDSGAMVYVTPQVADKFHLAPTN